MNHAPTSLMVLGARRQQRCRKWRFYRTRCQRMTLLSNATAVIPTVGWNRLQQVKRFIILVMSDNTGKKLPNVLDFVSYHTTSTSYRIVQYWSSRLWRQSSSFLLSLQNQKLRLLDSDDWWLLELCCCVVVCRMFTVETRRLTNLPSLSKHEDNSWRPIATSWL